MLVNLGLRSATKHASASFQASQCQSADLVSSILSVDEDVPAPSPSTGVALPHLSNTLQLDEPLVVEQFSVVSQKELSRRVDDVFHANLKEAVTDVTYKARLASLSLPHSGDWLNEVPCPPLGLHMRGVEFRVAILYRLGMPVFMTGGLCVAVGL